ARAKGIEITPEIGEARAGDPARLICSGERIARTLGRKSEHGPDDIVRSAVEARAAEVRPDVEAYPEARAAGRPWGRASGEGPEDRVVGMHPRDRPARGGHPRNG